MRIINNPANNIHSFSKKKCLLSPFHKWGFLFSRNLKYHLVLNKVGEISIIPLPHIAVPPLRGKSKAVNGFPPEFIPLSWDGNDKREKILKNSVLLYSCRPHIDTSPGVTENEKFPCHAHRPKRVLTRNCQWSPDGSIENCVRCNWVYSPVHSERPARFLHRNRHTDNFYGGYRICSSFRVRLPRSPQAPPGFEQCWLDKA